jgi:hypothetical protein
MTRCPECGRLTSTVQRRSCGYYADVLGTEVEEVCCDECENEHCMDI